MFSKQAFPALQVYCTTPGPNFHRQYYPYRLAGSNNVVCIGAEPGELYALRVHNILPSHGITGDAATEAVIAIDGVNPFTNRPMGVNPTQEPGVYLPENGSGYLIAWPEYEQTGRQLAFTSASQAIGTYVGSNPFSNGSLAVAYLREGYTPRKVYTLPTSITGTSLRPDYGNFRTSTIGSPNRGDVDVMFQGFQADAVRGDDGLTKGPATGLGDWTTQLLSQRQGLIMPVSTGIVQEIVYLWWSELKKLLTNLSYPATVPAMPRPQTGFNRPVAPLGGLPQHELYARFVS